MTEQIKLTAHHRNLHLPNGEILIYRYPEGDCDTIGWPLRKRQQYQAAAAVYDAMMTGEIDEGPVVLLPDGTEFEIHTYLR